MIRFSIFVTAFCFLAANAFAFNLKGKLQATTPNDFTIVAQDPSSEKVATTQVASNGKFTLNNITKGTRLSLLKDGNFAGPIVYAVKAGNVVSYTNAKKKNACQSGTATVILALKKVPKNKKGVSETVQLVYDSQNLFAYAKKSINKKFLSLDVNATAANSNCAPSGSSSAGVASLSTLKNLANVSAEDPDGDGSQNSADKDDDNDGISDTFDPDNDGDGALDDNDSDNNDKVGNRVWNFQQLHLDIENAYNTRVLEVSTATIDAALATYGGLAIQVISGTSVELNCGDSGVGLPYCIAGGTGRTREPFPNGAELPEGLDTDSDGKAEITAGSTGDFQVLPGATSSQILPGDTFIEEVTDSSSTVTKYVGMINAVVHDVPGIVSIATTLGTTTFSYPTSTSSSGTVGNPILVPSTGDVNVTVTTYVPHYNVGSEKRVVPGGIKMITNIPNGPCTLDTATNNCSGGGSGPGLLPGSLYSNPSTGWNTVSDGVQSATTSDVNEGDDQTVTYSINLTGASGVTGWDSGEQLKVPIQSLDNNGGTAAINVWFKRQ